VNFGAGRVPIHQNVGYVQRDREGGVTTLSLYVDLPGRWDQIEFIRNASLFMGLDRGKNIMYKSVNGRDNWDKVTLPNETADRAHSFAATSAGKLLYLSVGDRIYRTYNGGLIWKSVFTIVGAWWTHIVCTLAGKVIVVANGVGIGGIYYSTSFGSSWLQGANPPFVGVNNSAYYRNLLLVESSNGSATVYAVVRYVDPDQSMSSSASVADRFVVSRDQGRTWSLVQSDLAAVNVSTFACSRDCGVIAVVSKHHDLGLLLSADNGLHWKAVTFAFSHMSAAAISKDGDVVVVAGTDYNFELCLQISYNRGYSWSRFQSIYTSESNSARLLGYSAPRAADVSFAFDHQSSSLVMVQYTGFNSSQLFVGTTTGARYLQILF
jgi:hypothetical protein